MAKSVFDEDEALSLAPAEEVTLDRSGLKQLSQKCSVSHSVSLCVSVSHRRHSPASVHVSERASCSAGQQVTLAWRRLLCPTLWVMTGMRKMSSLFLSNRYAPSLQSESVSIKNVHVDVLVNFQVTRFMACTLYMA